MGCFLDADQRLLGPPRDRSCELMRSMRGEAGEAGLPGPLPGPIMSRVVVDPIPIWNLDGVGTWGEPPPDGKAWDGHRECRWPPWRNIVIDKG